MYISYAAHRNIHQRHAVIRNPMKKFPKHILTLAASIVIALVTVACAGNGDEATSTVSIPRSSEFQTQEAEFQTEEAEFGQYGVCYEPTESLREGLAQTLMSDDLGMRAFFMVRHPRDSTTWTLAVDIEGPDLEDEGPIALYTAVGFTVPRITWENVIPMNEVTLEHTNLEDSLDLPNDNLPEVFELQYETRRDGIELIQSCIHEELETNPDTRVYGLAHR